MSTSVFQSATRLADIGVSEILVRSANATALKKVGRNVIIFGAGEPDFDTPDHIKAAAEKAMADGQTKYTALDGSPAMKEAVRGKFLRDNGLSFSQDQVTVGAGAKQILYNAFMASLEPGDEVLIPAPFWTSYIDIVRICGGVPKMVPCSQADGFRLKPEALENAITARTRWLLMNSPSNPAGAVHGVDDYMALGEVLDRHPHVWILSDDIYEHILFDGATFTTFAGAVPRLADRTLTVNGVSKAFAMTGWRIGYGAGPAALIGAMAIVQSQSTSCPSSVSQAAAVAALEGSLNCVVAMKRSFQTRRDIVVTQINAIEGLSCSAPGGAFYAYISCAGLMGASTTDGRIIHDDRAFADHLLTHDVAVIPGACFGLSPFFRLSYACGDAELRKGLDRIAAACAALRKSPQLN
ncbi:pyridoxal phosphate-dependent aminotransferase [Sphingobium sp. CR2-8]|uniref:pyridoxal phosphate-dependent aminotransferase n=1 Tax=Sphingobium sp. CR2-8 TaxID=1306534 RepID=UPI002DB76D24|nr:pyridoxal phosphate-dependent aminotransferase [Sphingobium sp. CR2-8]MEC3909452.1 pyridoxal phosphate-dependent aminotransferase [Sphingobium sp. CR2-8]